MSNKLLNIEGQLSGVGPDISQKEGDAKRRDGRRINIGLRETGLQVQQHIYMVIPAVFTAPCSSDGEVCKFCLGRSRGKQKQFFSTSHWEIISSALSCILSTQSKSNTTLMWNPFMCLSHFLCFFSFQVVMAVAQLYFHLAPKVEVGVIAKALVRLLRSHRWAVEARICHKLTFHNSLPQKSPPKWVSVYSNRQHEPFSNC